MSLNRGIEQREANVRGLLIRLGKMDATQHEAWKNNRIPEMLGASNTALRGIQDLRELCFDQGVSGFEAELSDMQARLVEIQKGAFNQMNGKK